MANLRQMPSKSAHCYRERLKPLFDKLDRGDRLNATESVVLTLLMLT